MLCIPFRGPVATSLVGPCYAQCAYRGAQCVKEGLCVLMLLSTKAEVYIPYAEGGMQLVG